MNKFFSYELKYDPANLNEIQRFLDHINTIAISNPKLDISQDMIYGELEKWNLKSSDKNMDGSKQKETHHFMGWINEFANTKNINVFHTVDFKYWCQFTNGSYKGDYIKIYIPIDHNHLKEGVSRLFKFIADNDIKHESKVGSYVRSDNVIVRLHKGDVNSLNKIINFISNDRYIKEGLNKVNPFLPTINGIGVMNETGNSYNDFMSKYISNYFSRHRNTKRINVYDFINEIKSEIYEQEVKDTFDIATSIQDRKFTTPGELNKTDDLNIFQKQTLLNETVRTTIRNHGMRQGLKALQESILEKNYAYFTNDNKNLRLLVTKYISSADIQRIIESVLGSSSEKRTLDVMIFNYCNFICNNEFSKYFDDMCRVTLENYDGTFLSNAINNYIMFGNSNVFSRYKKDSNDKTNYRDYCKYVTKENIALIIRNSLQLKGINKKYVNINELVTDYVNTLKNSDYEKAVSRI